MNEISWETALVAVIISFLIMVAILLPMRKQLRGTRRSTRA